MRQSALLALGLVACTTRPDAPVDTQAPAAVPSRCSDVATADLNLGEATPTPLEACDVNDVAVALSQTSRWNLTKDALRNAERSLPLEHLAGTDVAAGYGDVAFVLDGTAGTIHRFEGNDSAVVLQDARLTGARALVRIGGSLFVGTPAGVAKVSLSDGQLAFVAQGRDVLDLAVDDIGALLLLTTDGLARVLPSGAEAPLSTTTIDATRIAFDLVTRQLLVVDSAGVVGRIDYATLAPEGPQSRPVAHGEMGPFFESGYILAGAEYWPHRGSTPAKYPEEILWGFYPHEGEVFEGAAATATATDAAVRCAEQSFAALRAWIPTATEALAKATAKGKAPRFYLWVNDYSEADDPFPADMRQAKLWYWARTPSVAGRIPGYFKWETVVDQKGECSWPHPEQALAFLEEAASVSPPRPRAREKGGGASTHRPLDYEATE